VTHEHHGLLVPEKDPAALHAAMVQLTGDAARCGLLGEAASRAVREEFEHRRAVERLEAIYDEALALPRT
jgi:glycosyltransferase involved in cell wall biosynthesis